MNETSVLKALEEVRKAPKRKFAQTVDMIVVLQNIDFKIPANKVDLKVVLPAGRGKDVRVGVFGDTDFLSKAKNADVRISDKELRRTPKEMRKVAEQADFFIAQTTLMVEVGKNWGKFLSTRGKMPQPMPPGADPTPMIMRLKNTTALRSRGNTPQSLSCAVGIESMKDEEIVKNVMAVYNALMEKLPGKENNIHKMILKTTMGPSIKLQL
jgi:large subunit ribosomal protein L1